MPLTPEELELSMLNLKTLESVEPLARYPAVYQQARTALEACTKIDECANWANKAEALASYAKQSADTTLRKMADRIQARAIRRCGELLRQVRAAKNQHENGASACGGTPTSRSQAAKDAGLSRDQKVQALRVANVPQASFDQQVESKDPPTVTDLARQGIDKEKADRFARMMRGEHLEGRDPKEWATANYGRGAISTFLRSTKQYDLDVVVRGSTPGDYERVIAEAKACQAWLADVIARFEAVQRKELRHETSRTHRRN